MNDASSTLSLPWAQGHSNPFFAARLLSHALKLPPLLKCYQQCLSFTDGPADFAERTLEALNISVELLSGTTKSLPASGPLLLAANHPFGAVEGLVLAALCTKARPDLKILVNQMLYGIPELRPLFIPVNVFTARGDKDNISSLRSALVHLESGGALAVFPSGVVSHWQMRERRVTDPEWNSLIGRMARMAGASVLPVYFEGRNSRLCQAAGCVHPRLRTRLLPRELWRMRGRRIVMRVGNIVEPDLLAALHSDKTRTEYIRARCYNLGRPEVRKAVKRTVPIADQQERYALLDEIRSLPPQRVLAESTGFRTLCVDCKESPRIMHEVGRLRERTFRAVHEGSGKALDIDRFDPHYIHLVLWDENAGAIAGGYRVRLLFPPVTMKAVKTLYTSSLFHYKKEFFERCGESMELGRAFVAPEYQRDYAPLMMLWKGICNLAAMVGTRTLLGATSIGLQYAPESVLMLRQHLEEHYAAPGLSPFVRGRRRPGAFSDSGAPDIRGIEYQVLDRAVKGLEGDKGVPILFKHYLQMGGRIAAFHEDRTFGTLDALMVVDLASAPERLLRRYMGQERLNLFRRAHSIRRNAMLSRILVDGAYDSY
jgi:putative hemolysin